MVRFKVDNKTNRSSITLWFPFFLSGKKKKKKKAQKKCIHQQRTLHYYFTKPLSSYESSREKIKMPRALKWKIQIFKINLKIIK